MADNSDTPTSTQFPCPPRRFVDRRPQFYQLSRMADYPLPRAESTSAPDHHHANRRFNSDWSRAIWQTYCSSPMIP